MRKLIVAILIFCSATTSSYGSDSCLTLFAAPELLKTIQKLAQLRTELDNAKVDGDESLKFSAMEDEYRKKENETLKKFNITRDTLKRLMREEVAKVSREKEQEKQREIAQRKEMEEKGLNEIRPVFNFLDTYQHPIVGGVAPHFMMANLVTQGLWRAVADIANSVLSQDIQIETDPSIHQGNDLLPLEHVSAAQVDKWIDTLNQLVQMDHPGIKKLIPDSDSKFHYRLPRIIELENIFNNSIPLLKNESDVSQYMWHKDNSNVTQPIGKLAPIEFQGKKFYDIVGNVFIFTEDKRQSGERKTFGLSREFPASFLEYFGSVFAADPDSVTKDVGIRLVREVRTP